MMRKLLRPRGMCFAACCAPLRYCSAVALPPTVRELAVRFMHQHTAAKTLKLDRGVVTALDEDQYLVEELRAAVWAASPKDHRKVIHGVGHRRVKVVDGIPHSSHNGTAVTHSAENVSVGGVPFIPSEDVRRVVDEHVRNHSRTNRTTRRVKLWCNSGTAGSGKSTLLAHSAAAAVLELEAMVREAVGSDAAALWLHRPLGFIVTFNTRATSFCGDHAFGTSHILTRIALRMLYSLCGAEKPESLSELEALLHDMADVRGVRRTKIATQQRQRGASVSFERFLGPFLASARLNADAENFDAIVSAMREVLEWEGPLFLAVDEFAKLFEIQHDDKDKEAKNKALTLALVGLCHHVLDASPPLRLGDGSRYAPQLYSRYCIVSVYHGADLVKMTTLFNRKLIAQPMPVISVLDMLRRYAQMSNMVIKRLKLPKMYSQLLNPSHRQEFLSIEQLLFLTEIALTRGHPREMRRVVEAYSRASGGRQV